MAHGGKRENAGRKPKADEQKLIEKLSPLEPIAHKALKNALNEEEGWAIKLYFEYMYGKPKQQIENTNINYSKEVTKEEIEEIKNSFFEKY